MSVLDKLFRIDQRAFKKIKKKYLMGTMKKK